MLLGETEAILSLMELQLQGVVVVAITTAAVVLLVVQAEAVVEALAIMLVVVAVELALPEEMQRSHHLLVVNTVLELLDKVIQAVEAADTFTLLGKAAAD
jgi:hypothetical protein